MLLSLHAQSHLGLVKDLAKGAIHFEGRQLPTFRCSKTGLLMISLTGGLIDATGNFQSVPKCHRKFRCCYIARNVALISPERGSGTDPANAMNKYEETFIGHGPSEHKDAQTAIDLAQL